MSDEGTRDSVLNTAVITMIDLVNLGSVPITIISLNYAIPFKAGGLAFYNSIKCSLELLLAEIHLPEPVMVPSRSEVTPQFNPQTFL